MLKLLAALVLIAGFAATVPVVAIPSQPPAKSQGAEAQAKTTEKETAKDQRGTDQTPPVVKVVAPVHNEREAAQETQDRKQQGITEQELADYTWYLVLATIALASVAILQAGLFVWQLIYMRRGLKDATDAARIAQDTLTATHRAWIRTPMPRLDGPIQVGIPIVIEMISENVGKEPAIGARHHGIAMIADTPEQMSYAPALWTPEFEEVIRLESELAAPIKGKSAIIFPGGPLSNPLKLAGDENIAEIISGKKFLILYGCIGYLTMGKPHFTYYCLYLTRQGDTPGKYRFGFAPIGNDAT